MEDRQESVEVVLAHTWAELREIMGPRVPTLGISLDHVPGKYLFTHPAPSNVVFWWYEIVDFARTIELSIRSAIAANVFLRQSSLVPAAKPIDDILERALLERDYHAESSIATLYAMREKISWLVFELIHHLVQSPPRQRQISYATILRLIDRSLSEGMLSAHYLGEPAMLKMVKAFRELGEPGIMRLFEFRHALTHHNRPRFQPRFDQPVIGRDSVGGWEILECGSYRFRFVEHLTLAAWSKYVEVLRAMAACAAWEVIGLKLHSLEYSLPSDAEQLVHSGRLAVDMGYGTAFVRCMKQCRGVDVSLEFKESIRDEDALRRVLTDVTKAFGPLLGHEPGERMVVGGQEEGQDRRLRVLLLIHRDDRVQSLSDLIAEVDTAVHRSITGADLLQMLAKSGHGLEVLRMVEAWLDGDTTTAVGAEEEVGGSAASYCVLLRRDSGSSQGGTALYPVLYQRNCGQREENAG